MMYRRVKSYKSSSPGYFQFVYNQYEHNDACNRIVSGIGEKWLWAMYTKLPWEGFKSSTTSGTDKKDYTKKVLAIECKYKDSENIVAVRTWIKTGQASKRCVPRVEFVEKLTTKIPPNQTERAICMNGNGPHFQVSVGLIEIQILSKSDGVLTLKNGNSTIQEMILRQQTSEVKPMFLSITKKRQSTAYHGDYIKLEQKSCEKCVACPAS